MPRTPRNFNALRALTPLACICLTALAGTACLADVFVSSEKDNAILQLDAEGKVIRSIAVCKRPRHMAGLKDVATGNTRIMVACGDSDQLGVVDLASGKMIDTVPTGESPEIFALSPDGKTAYVSIEDENLVAAYDISSKKPVFSVKTGAEPEGVLASPDGKSVYATSEVASSIYRIDVDKRKVVAQVKVGLRPRRFVLSPDALELWVSNELGASVSIIDTRSMKLKQTLQFNVTGMRASDITPVGMVMSADGKTVWVALGRANHVAEVDAATRTVKGLALVGKRAWGLALSKDGSRLYVANGLSDDMTIIDTANRKPLKTVPVGREPHSILVD
ncbi:MAG: PQQ-dependent catabolism-associated beta-propeller protein [Rhodoferax sp.]|nr:PQQ-dependent catabolism-associated beta-propeller protein [Rhodoferax sp.]